MLTGESIRAAGLILTIALTDSLGCTSHREASTVQQSWGWASPADYERAGKMGLLEPVALGPPPSISTFAKDIVASARAVGATID